MYHLCSILLEWKSAQIDVVFDYEINDKAYSTDQQKISLMEWLKSA